MADRRWKELKLTKILPVLFVLSLIFSLIVIYVGFHLLPLLRVKDDHTKNRGITHLIIFVVFTLMLLLSYVRAVLTHPGEVPERSPDGSVEWIVKKYSPDTDPELVDTSEPFLQESKRNGARRRCKYCAEAKRAAVQYKPDRCHHCKLCEMCILKMDHHCPWIYNCVGFKNHKFFLLTVFYSVLDTNFIFFTMWSSVEASVDKETDPQVRFWLVFGQTITALLGSVVSLFFYFHIWLMMKAMTTIEFCEKQKTRGYNQSIYDRGCYGNLEAALGTSPGLWLLPCSPPLGDGLSFSQVPTEHTPLGQGRASSSSQSLAPKSGE